MTTFEEIKARCIKENKLFEDPDFPARNTSIHPECDNPGDWLWRRPIEISDEPRFIIDGATRFDLIQGELGDCWFVAACAVLATKRDLFSRVVPPGQSFTKEYAGIFRFNFWRFGEWQEIYIDDRLPVTIENTLRYGQNRSQPDEYWGALLEKAYAKLYGSYSAIQAGHIKDALVDMTGGISEDFNLRKEEKLPPDLFDILQSSADAGSLMGCGIWSDPGSMTEELMWNGLYKGHAYSITKVLQTRISGWHVQLLRLRNPWGQKEWTGAWSDGSDEWKSLSEKDKKEIGLVFEDDGEFWMSFQDFLNNFHGLDIVHLGPESFARLPSTPTRQWQEIVYHGRWINGINAGGSGLLSDPTTKLYYTNPQYYFKLRDPDEDDVGGECTCVISLMQKDYRKRKQMKGKKLIIGFDIHQVKTTLDEPLTPDTYFDKAQLKKQHQTRTPLREVSCRLSLNPGTYCVIPNTLRPNQEGEFLLRIYTYTRIVSGKLDDDEGTTTYTKRAQAVEKPIATLSFDMFAAFAGDDFLIDARDLRDLLAELAKKEFCETLSFGIESCRTLIAMKDQNRTGVLSYDEMLSLWDDIVYWKCLSNEPSSSALRAAHQPQTSGAYGALGSNGPPVARLLTEIKHLFKKHDKDKSGCIETYELRPLLKEIGFVLPLDTLSALVLRYGGKDRNLFFEDFSLCLARTITLYNVFGEFSAKTPGEARLSLDQWLGALLYL